jgi:tetratricopeptide (TPR) repeat protein
MQAKFDLKAAKLSAQKAVEIQPKHALAWARLAELYLSTGNLQPGLDAATRAVELEPDLARTQTILGFAYLIQFDVDKARLTFERSLTLDSADPLARLGQGLAEIRDGHLQQGRRYIEIAASLDPNNALIRSYLGKAYYEENRSQVAGDQLQLAKDMDPADPTAWYYNAIRLQADNQPVDAMLDLQESIKLNDNRAVYRSRQLLDQDAAARSASVARIYQTLGFGQVALQEGARSVDVDPSNHSAHRFLADSYASLPLYENARRSELLQSQLLQPLNANPIQPQLADSNLGILSGAGPAGRASSDFNPLFTRNGTSFQMNAVVGSHGTIGEDIAVSGIHKNIAYSIGQHHFETDGFRENNDLNQDIYNAFLQVAITNNTSIQAEYQNRDQVNGDLFLNDGIDNFSKTDRYKRTTESGRLGLHHRVSSDFDMLMSLIYTDYKRQRLTPSFELLSIPFVPFPVTRELFTDSRADSESVISELQLIKKGGRFSYIAGAGNYNEDHKLTFQRYELVGAPFFLEDNVIQSEEVNASYWNAYLYSQLALTQQVSLTMGVAYDKLSSSDYDVSSLNPKLGLRWSSGSGTTLRMAYIEGVGRPRNSEQTIEPTQVAGFNQFFDDVDGAKTKRYGVALEQQLSANVFAGIELSKREIKAPVGVVGVISGSLIDERDETHHRAYAYWTPTKQLALSAEYYLEEDGGQVFTPLKLKTRRIPVELRYFWTGGHFASVAGTYIDQNYKDNSVDTQSDFWVVDAGVGFRLPKRQGSFQIVVRNLLDKTFSYYDSGIQQITRGTRNPTYTPDRQILAQFSFVIQ